MLLYELQTTDYRLQAAERKGIEYGCVANRRHMLP